MACVTRLGMGDGTCHDTGDDMRHGTSGGMRHMSWLGSWHVGRGRGALHGMSNGS